MRCNASPAQGLRPGLLSDVPSGLKTSALGRARPVTPKSNPPAPVPSQEGGAGGWFDSLLPPGEGLGEGFCPLVLSFKRLSDLVPAEVSCLDATAFPNTPS